MQGRRYGMAATYNIFILGGAQGVGRSLKENPSDDAPLRERHFHGGRQNGHVDLEDEIRPGASARYGYGGWSIWLAESVTRPKKRERRDRALHEHRRS